MLHPLRVCGASAGSDLGFAKEAHGRRIPAEWLVCKRVDLYDLNTHLYVQDYVRPGCCSTRVSSRPVKTSAAPATLAAPIGSRNQTAAIAIAATGTRFE